MRRDGSAPDGSRGPGADRLLLKRPQKTWLAVLATGLVTLLLTAVALVLMTGTGDSSGSDHDAASRAAAQCRADWRQLAAGYDARGGATLPSDLAPRWQALAANASLRETTSKGDCSVALGAIRATADQIDALSTRLRPYDLGWALTNRSKEVSKALADRAPQTRKSRRALQRAFADLERFAAAAAADMDAGWQTANSIDLDEPAQVARLMSDMGFLARDSATYGAGHAALTRVDRLVSLSRRSR